MDENPSTSFSSNGQQNEPIPPNSQYNKFSDSLRRVAPQHLSCSVFCGGRKCKYERGSYWPAESCCVNGIYSHWITDNIVAMSRPNTTVMEEYDVIGQFHTLGIKSLINLEVPGEHASCSLTPLHPNGFSYDPVTLMENGIYFYNYAWRDYGEASVSFLLDMVKVLSFSISEGKVGVHCHAGLGRTGVLISCYLVYALRLRANDAIRLVRSKRPGSVQSRLHILIVQQFEQFILPNCVVFCNRDLFTDRRLQEFTLSQYLKRQRIILHGKECKTLKMIPKIINVICERLLMLCGRPSVVALVSEDEDICHPIPGTPDTPVSESFAASNAMTPTESVSTPSDSSSSFKSISSHIVVEIPYKADDILRAFLSDHIHMSDGLTRFIRQYRIELNQKGLGAWTRLSNERNLYILTGLLFLWLEHLRHPILGSDELTTIVLHANDHRETLRRLPADISTTLEYLMSCLAHLEPSPTDLEVLLRRFSAALTQRAVFSTKDIITHGGYHSILPEKGKPRKLSDGTLRKVLDVLHGMIHEYLTNPLPPPSGSSDNFKVRMIVPRKLAISSSSSSSYHT